MTRFGKIALAGGLVALIGVGGAIAQGMHHRYGPPGMQGHGMGGPMMGGRMMERLCSGDQAQFSERMIDRVAGRLRVTDAQKPALTALQDSITKAVSDAKALCAEKPDMSTASGRLTAAERRLELMSQGLKTIHPKLDAFYATLDEGQKAKFNAMGPGERGRGRGGPDGPGRGGPRPPAAPL